MENFLKSNSLPKLFLLCLVMPIAAGCQTGASPKTTENKNQTISNVNQEKTVERKKSETETISRSSSASGFAITKNDVVQKSANIEDFAPKNWYLMMKAEGDLNNDGLPDAVAAFSKAKLFDGKDESNHSLAQSEADINADRVLIIALRDTGGLLNLDELSQKIILCRTCGGQMDDTLTELAVRNGAVEISQNALGTSSANYLHKLKKDARRGWIVFYGEGKYRQRSSGKESAAKQKRSVRLSEFDISEEIQELGLISESPKKPTK